MLASGPDRLHSQDVAANRWWVLLGALALAACGENSTESTSASGSGGGGATTGAGAGGGSGGGGVGGNGLGGASYTVDWGPVTIPPSTEDTQCVLKRLGNPEAMHVGAVRNDLGLSHHLIVYTSSETEEVPEPFPCVPFLDTLDPSKGSPIMVSQKAEDTLVLPQGVGFGFAANQMIRLELHYINTSSEDQTAAATSTFYELPADQLENEAGFLFIGNPDIDLQPMSTDTLGPTYFVPPSTLAGSKYFAITGHTHQYGTNVTVATSDSPGGSDTMVYDVEDWMWDEPETVTHDPPFEVPDGGGFRFTCEWNNTSTQTIGFGESANQEMCFFWAYYFPNQGSLACAHTDQVPGGLDICCPGNPLCSQLF